jgi:hypothetical protein
MTALEIARLIIRIEETVNPDSEYYGKLVKWWEQEKELWHYGIGLSNTHFFNIGTIEAKELQILKRHDIIEHDIIEHRNLDIRGVPGIYSPFESDEIIERLKYSLRWLNDLPENSSKKKINGKALAFLIFTDDEAGTDKDREPIDIDFASYLKQQSPQLKHNIIRDIFEKGKNWVYIFLGIFGVWIVVAIALTSGEFGIDQQTWINWLLSGALISLPVIIISTWISNFKWSGFQKKSFWDWLQLLIVPLILAFGAFYLNSASETRDKQRAKEGKQQELLKDYFSKMQTLILAEKTLPKSNNKPTGSPSLDQNQPKLSPESQAIARALTLAVLDELDGPRKGKVITYLAESNLINKPNPEIKLDRANLQDLVLQDVDMNGVKIYKADMTRANLTDVKLTNADLTLSIFSSATLQGVDFSGATLNLSNFYNTKLKNITISTSSKFQNVCYSQGNKRTEFENTEDDKNQITWLKLTDFENTNTNSRITETDRWCNPTEQNLKKNLD